MHPFRDSIRFCLQNIEGLFLLAITILLPFLLIQYLTVNYVYYITAPIGISLFGDLADSFLMVLFLMVAQLPFIQYVQSDLQGDERPLRKAYKTFFKYGFSVFLFGLIYSFAVFTGLLLLIIPGIIVLVLLYLTPFITVIKQQTTRHAYHTAIRLGKNHFFPLFCLICLNTFVELVITAGSVMGVTFVTSEFSAIFITQTLLNLIIYPFFVVLFTMFVHKWQVESHINISA